MKIKNKEKLNDHYHSRKPSTLNNDLNVFNGNKGRFVAGFNKEWSMHRTDWWLIQLLLPSNCATHINLDLLIGYTYAPSINTMCVFSLSHEGFVYRCCFQQQTLWSRSERSCFLSEAESEERVEKITGDSFTVTSKCVCRLEGVWLNVWNSFMKPFATRKGTRRTDLRPQVLSLKSGSAGGAEFRAWS